MKSLKLLIVAASALAALAVGLGAQAEVQRVPARMLLAAAADGF